MVNLQDNLQEEFDNAIILGDIQKVVQYIHRVDPAAENNKSIRYAAEDGNIDIVELLLNDARVDPTDEDNSAIRLAAENGHTDVVALLLQDARVDPAARNNWAIRGAAYSGHTDVVALLLKDARVNPAVDNNWAIRSAAINNHIDTVKLLLYDPRVWINPPSLDWSNVALRRILEAQMEAAAAAIHAFQQRWRGVTSSWLYEPALHTLVEQYLPLELYRVLEHLLRTGAYDPTLLQTWIQRLTPTAPTAVYGGVVRLSSR